MTTNAQITAELAGLHAAVARLEALQLSTTQNPHVTERIAILGNGSGAGSPAAYQDMITRNWHGRLGRTHMVDVDQMQDSTRKELDCFLRRTIHLLVPVGTKFTIINPDLLFATLSAFGLRLDDRGPLADVTITADSNLHHKPTLARLQNFSASYYTRSDTYVNYWKGLAMETVIELARYRGLFGADGFLTAVN